MAFSVTKNEAFRRHFPEDDFENAFSCRVDGSFLKAQRHSIDLLQVRACEHALGSPGTTHWHAACLFSFIEIRISNFERSSVSMRKGRFRKRNLFGR